MRHGIVLLLAVALSGSPVAARPKKPKNANADLSAIGQRDINKGKWNLYSTEREIEMGERLATQTERTSRLLDDAVVIAYVAQVAERVVRHSDLRIPLRVHVIDSDELNAFALPGGHFFIHTGLIRETQSEAELASVIAHEIAHVAARHATRQMTRVQVWNLMSLPLMFVGGPIATGIQQGFMLAVPLSFLKFSRNAEREADLLGQEYHYASGYDPSAFVTFFERMKQREKNSKSGIAKAFSTHPMTKDRIVAAERTIEGLLPPREEYVVTTSQYGEIRQHLMDTLGERRRKEEGGGPSLRDRSGEDRSGGNAKPNQVH